MLINTFEFFATPSAFFAVMISGTSKLISLIPNVVFLTSPSFISTDKSELSAEDNSVGFSSDSISTFAMSSLTGMSKIGASSDEVTFKSISSIAVTFPSKNSIVKISITAKGYLYFIFPPMFIKCLTI